MWPSVGRLRTMLTCNERWLNSSPRFSPDVQPMSPEVKVPTALRATYEFLTTVSATVARRYLEVATVLQRTFTAAEFSIWTQHCVQLAQSGWRAWESTDAFLQLSPFLQQHLVA